MLYHAGMPDFDFNGIHFNSILDFIGISINRILFLLLFRLCLPNAQKNGGRACLYYNTPREDVEFGKIGQTLLENLPKNNHYYHFDKNK